MSGWGLGIRDWVRAVLVVLGCLGWTALAQSAVDDTARAIGGKLKCPVCSGLPITESPSDFARSMLAEVAAQVKAGKSEAEIKAFFVDKYGSSVLLEPPWSGATLLVWLLPLAAIGLGGWGLYSYLRRASQHHRSDGADPALLERVRAMREGKS